MRSVGGNQSAVDCGTTHLCLKAGGKKKKIAAFCLNPNESTCYHRLCAPGQQPEQPLEEEL